MNAGTTILSQGKRRHPRGGEAARRRLRSAKAKIFKKSPIGANLQPTGRDVAKHLAEITSIPLLNRILLGQGMSQGEVITLAARAAAENVLTVNTTHHRAAALCADRPELRANRVSVGRGAGIPDRKLTDGGSGARKSERPFRATYVPGHSGAATHCGGAHENQYYATI